MIVTMIVICAYAESTIEWSLKTTRKTNVAKTAVARELACFLWGMMTENYT